MVRTGRAPELLCPGSSLWVAALMERGGGKSIFLRPRLTLLNTHVTIYSHNDWFFNPALRRKLP